MSKSRPDLALLVAELIFVVWALARPAMAEETPFDPGGGTSDLRSAGNVTGLEQTTWSDPDWVLATSDLILQANLCIASPPCCTTCWYDRVNSEPCYWDTLLWKFSDELESACAFPMGSLGEGTFDGLYVRGGVAFRLFNPTTFAPFGPAMTGPRFASIDCWASGACDGFEPGTILVHGGPGALSSYAITLGGSTRAVDLRVDSNNDGFVDAGPPPADCAGSAADDCLENEAGLARGLLLPVNNNDSDYDGVADHLEAGTGGTAYESDLRDFYVRVGFPDSGGFVRLSVDTTEEASRFRLYTPHLNRILGCPDLDENEEPVGSPITVVKVPMQYFALSAPPCEFSSFYLEGVDPGVARITATVVDEFGQEHGKDTVKINVYRISAHLSEDVNCAGGTVVVSADQPQFPYVTAIDFVDEYGNEVRAGDGSEVEYAVVSGSPSLSVLSTTTCNGFTSTLVTSPTTAGSVFQLSARVTRLDVGGTSVPVVGGLEHVSPQIEVVAGPPALVDVVFDGGVTSYPASGANKIAATVTSADAAGNPTPDGTGVVVDLVGDGSIDAEVTEFEITGGSARVGTVASLTPGTQELTVIVGEQEIVQTIDEVPIDVVLTPAVDTLPIRSGLFVDVFAEVVGADGSAVADGTEIVWVSNLGSLSTDGVMNVGPVAVGTVVDGQSFVRLSTVATNAVGEVISGLERAGTAWVIAAIGQSNAFVSIEFTEPPARNTPLRIHLEHQLLAGDAVTDGTIGIEEITDQSRYEMMIDVANALGADAATCPSCDLDGDGTITLVDLIQARNAPDPPLSLVEYYAGTPATITGGPFDVVEVSVSDPGLVTILGVDALGQVTLDDSGVATITLQSTGALVGGPVLVDVTVRRVGGGRGSRGDDDDDEDEVKLVLLEKEPLGWFKGFWYNFGAGLIGEGQGAVAFASDAAVSFGLLGDIRDIGIQTCKLWPGGDDPDKLVLLFATVGIVTTAAGPLDVTLTGLKRIAKKLSRLAPGTGGAKVLRRVIQELVQRVKDLDSFWALYGEWKVFFKVLLKNDNFIRLIAHYGDEAMSVAKRVLARLGASWAGHFVKVAADFSIAASKKAFRALDAVDEATLKVLKGWSPGRQQRLVAGLAGARGVKLAAGSNRWVGEIDDGILKALLDKDKIEAIEAVQRQFPELGEGFDVMMEQLGKVARNGTGNTNAFADKLNGTVRDYLQMPDHMLPNLKGHLNELKQSASVVDDPAVHLLETGRRVRTAGGRIREVDAIGELATGQKVLYEFKHGTSFANPGKRQREKLLSQIKAYVEMAKPGSVFPGAKVVVHLEGGAWKQSFKQALMALGDSGVVVEVLP